MSRDPIGERGGVNLYGFVRNDGVASWDAFGFKADRWDYNPDVLLPPREGEGTGRSGHFEPHPRFQAWVNFRIPNLTEHVKIDGSLTMQLFVRYGATGSERKIALKHERRHAAIEKMKWNMFVDTANVFEGWYCVPCGEKVVRILNALYLKYRTDSYDAQLRFDMSEYHDEENNKKWALNLGKKMKAEDALRRALDDASGCF